jgi:23S rRNA (cytosine1962-C5)-methyltransferase
MRFFQSSKKTNTFRLVHGEADFLPGIAIDIYGSTVMCMVSARVAWDHRLVVVQTLQKLLNPLVILVSTDSAFCGVEKLQETTERYVGGILVADRQSSDVVFREHGLYYSFQPGSGQKSGFFCDQRDNRSRVAAYAKDKTVLDAFSYTGAFSFNMLAQGARSVTAVDSSAPALERLASQLELNIGKGRLPADSKDRMVVQQADVFQYLRDMRPDTFDMIVLDPPKLAHTKAQVDGALRAYKDLNRLAIQKVPRGGIVATFSCSSGVSRDMLRTAIAWAAKDARREVQILEMLGQSSDHPIRLSFPESEYLKGFIFLVL